MKVDIKQDIHFLNVFLDFVDTFVVHCNLHLPFYLGPLHFPKVRGCKFMPCFVD